MSCENDSKVKSLIMSKTYWLLCMCFMLIGLTFGSIGRAHAQQISAEEYIERYKDVAIAFMDEHGCPASIILAVAMHESAHGNSRIARYLNNHFGIKGKNNSTEIRSAYKGYDSVADSYRDFIDFLKRRKATRQLFDQYQANEYQQWARGIARAGYAQSSSWSARVIGMIQKYNLHEFDRVDASTAPARRNSALVEQEEQETYVVKKGDTLSAIARKYDTTVKAIQQQNGLSGSRLQIGQQLFL